MTRDIRNRSSESGKKIWRAVKRASNSVPEWARPHVRRMARQSAFEALRSKGRKEAEKETESK